MEDLNKIVHVDSSAFPCSEGYDMCPNRERTISFASFVDLPEPVAQDDLVFKECCYLHNVLASTDSSESYKNDYSGFYHKRQVASENCVFVLIDLSDGEEYELNDDTYGVYKNFNSILEQPNLSTYILNWKSVLSDLGEGSYKVLKRVNLVGISVEIEYLVYNLYEYSSSKSDNTVRIDVEMSGLLEKENVDFTGSDFKTTLRVPGFFGRRDAKYEEDNLVNRNYVKKQISMKQTNEYKFQTNLIPDCISNEIFDFLLFSDNIQMNDYNLNNHSYDFKYFKVKLESNEGTEHFTTNRKVRLNLLFNDKTVNNNKRNY